MEQAYIIRPPPTQATATIRASLPAMSNSALAPRGRSRLAIHALNLRDRDAAPPPEPMH